MLTLPADDPRSIALIAAIHTGDTSALQHRLDDAPALATMRIVDAGGVARSLLHVVADWPGHRPASARVVAMLAAAGADVDAALTQSAPGGAPETPLHWAASCDDLEVLDALLDAGADIEAPGAVFTGGSAMSNAVVFAQWRAAHRLLERGATTTIWQAAALGLLDRVRAYGDAVPAPPPQTITNACWHACRGGQQETAEYLHALGADINWIGYDHRTPCDVARESDNTALLAWLRSSGGRFAAEST